MYLLRPFDQVKVPITVQMYAASLHKNSHLRFESIVLRFDWPFGCCIKAVVPSDRVTACTVWDPSPVIMAGGVTEVFSCCTIWLISTTVDGVSKEVGKLITFWICSILVTLALVISRWLDWSDWNKVYRLLIIVWPSFTGTCIFSFSTFGLKHTRWRP